MVKGWAKFMYEDKVTLVEAGDVVHQRPGIRHYLFDYSPDMEYGNRLARRFQRLDGGRRAGLRHSDPNPWDKPTPEAPTAPPLKGATSLRPAKPVPRWHWH